jgi:hypothetical protein
MKTFLILLLTAATMIAAPLCYDIPTNTISRVQEAYGAVLNLKDANGNPRIATQQEIADAAQHWTQQTTQDYERRKNMAQFSPAPVVPPSPTPTPTPTVGAVKAAATPKKK